MKIVPLRVMATAVSAVLVPCLPAADDESPELEVSADEVPRIPATEPAEALSTFEVAPEFDLALAAHEPDVADPIAMTFDEAGRAWVIEMRGYSERREEALGRVRVLTDRDGDGRFDESTVFVDGLKWPTAILCYEGGVFVGATPDVYYFRDTDGDDRADEKRVVFTGFGEGKPRLNMQALFNSFRWGPDNRIWGATAANGGVVTRPDSPSFEPVKLRGSDFSFDPEKLDLRPENGTAQYGLGFDSRGRRFVCSNSRHAIWVAWERRHLRDNPWYRPPRPLVDIPDDGAAAPVYRISPDEPWRIVRTRWRVAGVVGGPVEGGGRVSGYFTSATGIHPYWGDAFGEGFRDNLFIGDVGSNLVHRKRLVDPDGAVQPVATRARPQEKTEFLRSRDNWFRPTSFATGPDGCLYVTDMYREVIEHPWSLPEPIKEHLDLNSGFRRGRIYRVAPEDHESNPAPDLSRRSIAELRALLDHPNDWHRTTARRLLYERGRPAPPVDPVHPFPALLDAREPLLDHVEEAADDRWIRAAVLNSLRRPRDILAAWEIAAALPAGELHAELARLAGRSSDESLVRTVARDLAGTDIDPTLADRVDALHDGLRRAGVDRGFLRKAWHPLVERASGRLTDESTAEEDRIAAIRLLASVDSGAADDPFRRLVETEDTAPAVVIAAADALDDLPFLVMHWGSLPDSARTSLANRIPGDAGAATAFLEAVRDGSIDLSATPASLLEALRDHADEQVKSLAAEVLPEPRSRADVIAEYRRALEIEGDPEAGREVFARTCQACHVSHEGEGIDMGPPLTTFATAGGETQLGNILDPNREVAPQYQAYTFTFEDAPPVTGLIAEETPEVVTVRLPGGVERTFPRDTVESMQSPGVSLMPEGLETAISVEEMADLLAYLQAGGQ